MCWRRRRCLCTYEQDFPRAACAGDVTADYADSAGFRVIAVTLPRHIQRENLPVSTHIRKSGRIRCGLKRRRHLEQESRASRRESWRRGHIHRHEATVCAQVVQLFPISAPSNAGGCRHARICRNLPFLRIR